MITFNDIKTINNRNDIPKLINMMQARYICEIGVKNGENFKNLLQPNIIEAVAVDCWSETGIRSQNDDMCSVDELNKQYQYMIDWSKNDNRIKVIKNFSLEACKQFKNGYFDFIYIDADHTESAVYSDINAWWEKMRHTHMMLLKKI
jgi:hypothetical protein